MHGYKFSEILRVNILIHAQIENKKKKKQKNHILISIFYFLLFYGVINI